MRLREALTITQAQFFSPGPVRCRSPDTTLNFARELYTTPPDYSTLVRGSGKIGSNY